MTISVSTLGYPLLIAGVGSFLSFSVKNERMEKTCCAVANLANSYAVYKAFKAPYFATGFAAACIVSCFKNRIVQKVPAAQDSLDKLEIVTMILAIGTFIFSSSKFFECLLEISSITPP